MRPPTSSPCGTRSVACSSHTPEPVIAMALRLLAERIRTALTVPVMPSANTPVALAYTPVDIGCA